MRSGCLAGDGVMVLVSCIRLFVLLFLLWAGREDEEVCSASEAPGIMGDFAENFR